MEEIGLAGYQKSRERDTHIWGGFKNQLADCLAHLSHSLSPLLQLWLCLSISLACSISLLVRRDADPLVLATSGFGGPVQQLCPLPNPLPLPFVDWGEHLVTNYE